MSRIHLLPLVCVSAALSGLVSPALSPALSKEPAAGPTLDCANAMSTYEMNTCADRDFAAADAKLNGTYKLALQHIAANGGEKPYDSKNWEAAMRASQRAWVAFRDADCKDLEPMAWDGGTGTTVAVLGCMTQMTRTRTKELQERYALN